MQSQKSPNSIYDARRHRHSLSQEINVFFSIRTRFLRCLIYLDRNIWVFFCVALKSISAVDSLLRTLFGNLYAQACSPLLALNKNSDMFQLRHTQFLTTARNLLKYPLSLLVSSDNPPWLFVSSLVQQVIGLMTVEGILRALLLNTGLLRFHTSRRLLLSFVQEIERQHRVPVSLSASSLSPLLYYLAVLLEPGASAFLLRRRSSLSTS